ncbi:MlaA family lipoprotein [uncultured Sulfitobacter sp.]|uniref:MlaA family lipoprotein n=1 Tax=Sulfitobacter sp. SH22 TaxID=3421172 RepID=UPI0025F491D3|nr:VacJ family lipoprotein [uncultured Sulfitobacter sp.]
MVNFSTAPKVLRNFTVCVLVAGLAACGSAARVQPTGINDPHEQSNRKVHALNKQVAGSGKGGGLAKAVPSEFQTVIHNVAENMAMPQVAVNSFLQGDVTGFGLATSRFAINTVLGFAGVVDAASAFKVPEHDTDFGETLYVWGVGEGPYYELPIIGPSTRRDVAGRIVDLFTNPLSYTLESPEKYVGTVTGLADRVFTKSRRSDAIADAVDGSTDSYAQARLNYLQNRRFELSQPTGTMRPDAD